jgi:hypothetical protein
MIGRHGTPIARNRRAWRSAGHKTMHEFIRSTISCQKLQQLYVKAALGNFIGYVAGSLVTVLTTYHSIERRALKNLFGILPRHSVVVHRLPEWLEWTLSILIGYLVMEFVRYIFRSNKYLPVIDGTARDKARDNGEQPTATG